MAEPGVDIHIPYEEWNERGPCWRCVIDAALYGDWLWDIDTLYHKNPLNVRWYKDGTYYMEYPVRANGHKRKKVAA